MKFTKEDPKAEQRLKRKELKQGEIYSCIHATEGTYFMPIDINGAPYLINIATGNTATLTDGFILAEYELTIK